MQHISIPNSPILQGSVAALLTFSALFNATGIASGVKKCTIRADATHPVLLEIWAEVKTAFNAATTNVLTVGSDAASANQFLGSSDITEGTPGFYPAANAVVKKRIVADTDIFVKYVSTGVLQQETASIVEDVLGTLTAGNATVTVTAAGMPNSPKAVVVALATNDSQNAVATKVRAALAADSNVGAFFTVGGATNAIILTKRVATANDATLNIAYADTTSAGLTDAATSSNTTAGTAPATTGDALIYVRVTPLFPSPNGPLS